VTQTLRSPVLGVDLWLVDLDAWAQTRPDTLRALPAGEQARGARLRSPRDRLRFLAGRAALRHGLAKRLDADPDALELGMGAFGKPCLRAAAGCTLQFNISHSSGLALMAAGPVGAAAQGVEPAEHDGALGVDIELLRPVPDAAELAAEHFDPAERRAFLALAPSQISPGFLQVWTRKEACLKAWGVGLHWPVCAVAVGGGAGAARVDPPTEHRAPSLSLRSLHGRGPEGAAWVGALACALPPEGVEAQAAKGCGG
jgi:4'-phosphopantetheinyl transferase